MSREEFGPERDEELMQEGAPEEYIEYIEEERRLRGE